MVVFGITYLGIAASAHLTPYAVGSMFLIVI